MTSSTPCLSPGLSPGHDSDGEATRGSSTSGISAEKQSIPSPSRPSRLSALSLSRFVPWTWHNGRQEKNDIDSPAAESTCTREKQYNRGTNLGTLRQRLFGTLRRRLISGASIIVIMLIVLLATLLTLLHRPSAGAPSFESQGNGTDPLVVDVAYGQYRGVPLPNGIVQWLGMRYSGPPTGSNRFAAPIPPEPFSGVLSANKIVPGCYGIGPRTSGTAEDCTSIDVYAPSNASPDSHLPVYVFIQGGGNEAATAHFNGSNLIQASGMNMVFVTFSYRAGAYGFLASSEIQSKASLNNGYKDQRQAMQWVKDHIASFGGDPNSITLGGQSAGAGAAVAQLTAYGKTSNDGLFHAAIIQSPSTPPIRTVAQQQFQYDDLVAKLNCTSSSDTLACLRAVPHSTFLSHVDVIPYPDGGGQEPVFGWNPVVDGDFLPAAPLDAIVNGSFVSVPTIIGDVTDEGTIFTPQNLSDSASVTEWLRGTFPALNSSEFSQLSNLYNLSTNSSGASSPYWYVAAALYGELRYTCPSTEIATLLTQHGNADVWRYRFDVVDPAYAGSGYGVFHGADMPAVFGTAGYPGVAPKSYSSGQSNANIVAVVQGYWSSFVRGWDPNAQRASGAPTWDKWGGAMQRLHLLANDSAMEAMPDDQQGRCRYLQSIAEAIGQ